MKMTSFDLV
uniref:Uncharacterized protein n=1 Tax=Arundo donax TaxID=35708 RepID=A0A0A8YEV4_ARUDO